MLFKKSLSSLVVGFDWWHEKWCIPESMSNSSENMSNNFLARFFMSLTEKASTWVEA
jgi:hypothetical protein